jgi:formate hydrogenlyase subunit 3/multisubunit Na+/H+ antiporter MnhD subunit
MFCTNCGNQIDDKAVICPKCGVPVKGGNTNIKSYMVWSVLVTFACCLPLGAVAIYYSSQVNSRFNAGDIAGAEKASKNAKTCIIAGVILGIIAIVMRVLPEIIE